MNDAKDILEEKYDVVIVGSGPAGGATAKALSGHLLKTLIIEIKELPRYKMCSGIVSPSAVKFVSENFGDIPNEAYSDPIDFAGVRMYLTMDSPVIEIPASQMSLSISITSSSQGPADIPTRGVWIKRPEFDYWLCRSTDAVIVDRCKFKDYRKENNEIFVSVVINNETVEVATNYLVAADGTMSKVRKTLSPDFVSRLRLIPNYEELYRGEIDLEPGWSYAFYDRKITGFFATVCIKDNSIILTTGVKQGESVKKVFQEFVKFLTRKYGLKVKEKLASHGCILHDMSATGNFFIGKENILLTGEAGGFSRGAEGIPSALISGKAAGESILRSIERGQPASVVYAKAIVPEIELCKMANQRAFGVNPFTRTD